MLAESDIKVGKNPYLEKAKEVLEDGKTLFKSTNWTHILTKDGTKLSRTDRKRVSQFSCYLVETEIEGTMEDIVDKKIWQINEKKAKENDPKVLMWKEVEKGNSWKVCSQYNKVGIPFWDRHFVFSQTKIVADDGKIYLVAFSVDHPEAKVNIKTHVKGTIYLSVYEFSQVAENRTSVKRVTQVDPEGYIAVAIVEAYAGNLVDMFNRWKE